MVLDVSKSIFGVCVPQLRNREDLSVLLFAYWKVSSRFATSETSIFKLVSVAVETDFSLALSETPSL